MKKWRLRILSAFLTFTLGLCAASIVRFRLAPAAKVQSIYDRANIQVQLPPLPIAEDTQPTDKADEVMQPHPVSISPYEIKRLVDENELSPCEHNGYSGYLDFEPIWERLSIKSSGESGALPEIPGRCTYVPAAKIFALELDGKPGNETLLRLDFGEPYASLYLIFKYINKQGNAEWNLLGSLSYLYGAPFIPPSHRVVTDGGKHRWLAIDFSTGHGSAYGRSAESWYEISGNGVRQVLSYQSGLYWGMAYPTIDSDTKVLKVEHRDGVDTVLLQCSTSYGFYERFDDRHHHLWTANRKVSFIRGPGMQEFIFDPLHSELTEEALNSSEDDLVTSKDFLKYNYRELAKIAARGNRKQKEWLRDFLKDCDDSVEKQSLQKALEGAQP